MTKFTSKLQVREFIRQVEQSTQKLENTNPGVSDMIRMVIEVWSSQFDHGPSQETETNQALDEQMSIGDQVTSMLECVIVHYQERIENYQEDLAEMQTNMDEAKDRINEGFNSLSTVKQEIDNAEAEFVEAIEELSL